MVKNALLGFLVFALIVESGYLVVTKARMHSQEETSEARITIAPTRPPLFILTKGTKLSTTPLAKYAFMIAPTMPDSSKAALTGWQITTKANTNGTTTVTLTPKDSDDQDQQYTLKANQVLYFVEMTKGDDKTDSDKDLNYRDDYGVITDATGIVQ